MDGAKDSEKVDEMKGDAKGAKLGEARDRDSNVQRHPPTRHKTQSRYAHFGLFNVPHEELFQSRHRGLSLSEESDDNLRIDLAQIE